MPTDGRRAAHPGGAGDASPAKALIEVSDVSLRLGDQDVLQHVDLTLHRGEILTLIGPNGAGKTSLLRIVLGLLKPTKGRVACKKGVTFGYVPQRFAIDQTLPLTVRRFLALPQRRTRADIRAALAEVGVAYTLERELFALSGGEFQRVMLARALLRRPDVLVLDEPLQGVDVNGQVELFDLIGRLRRQHGFAVLMVSHDLHLVMSATDHVLCLNHHVCCHGEPESVSQHPEYLDLFGREAGRALAIYTHAHDHAHDAEGNVVPLGGSDSGQRKTGNGLA